MNNPTLFDYMVGVTTLQAKTLCHKADPETSRVAAQKIIKKLTEKQKSALRAIRAYCQNHVDFTPKEVAGGINRLYFDIQRRKNELADKGFIALTGSPERGGCEVWKLL